MNSLEFGKKYKDSITKPGDWYFTFLAFGECLPKFENKVELDYDNIDRWGIPKLVVDMEFGENEREMRKEMASSSAEMLDISGFKDINTYDNPSEPGLSIHEMGTARMGHDPKTSVLNKWNQIHSCKNVYVTDGSFMTSTGCQNPSLTYMAFTARAANHAAEQIKNGIL